MWSSYFSTLKTKQESPPLVSLIKHSSIINISSLAFVKSGCLEMGSPEFPSAGGIVIHEIFPNG